MVKRKAIAGLALLAVVAVGIGCARMTYAGRSYPSLQPVPPPSPEHGLKVQNLLIISDISRSMRDLGKVETERALLASFNQGIPAKLKNAGMRTFGKSPYYHTVLVQPIEAYNRGTLARLIDGLHAGWGNTPLASALVKAQTDLEDTTGNIAVVAISDGENLSQDPIPPVVALKEMYGDRVCIHTIHVGDSAEGRVIMKQIAKHSGCGIAVTAASLQSTQAIKGFITDVFYRHEYIDSDGDGVPDWADQCPNTPKGVKVDSIGCWVAKGLRFDFDKWDIKPEYYPVLDEVVHVLKMNPELKVEIHGHTDSMGADEYNIGLSKKRSEAVKDYLVSRGINAARLTTKGMGKADPVATNDTPAGRAQNRRVEFNIISY